MKIWEDERAEVWVEQCGHDLLFYGQGEKQKDRDLVVVTMDQLVEIVQNSKPPEETSIQLTLEGDGP